MQRAMNLIENDATAICPAYKNIQKAQLGYGRLGAIREHVEEIYALTNDTLDKNFREAIKYDFHPRYAEMYVSAVFMDRCGFKIAHPSDKGPDFFLEATNCWIEVVTASDGEAENPNSVPQRVSGEARQYPENEVILRLSNAFSKKSKKMLSDIDKWIVDPSHPIIICISGGAMTERFTIRPAGGLPQIAKAVFSIGEMYLQQNPKTKESSIGYKFSEGVKKKSDTGDILINTDYFLTEEHSHISAVVYSYVNVANYLPRDKWGNDFITIYNPKAKNPLPKDFIKCGEARSVSLTETDGEFVISKVRIPLS